jgi:hypothetical protein
VTHLRRGNRIVMSLAQLPHEVLSGALSLALSEEPRAVARLSLVSRQLYESLICDEVWKPICERFGFQQLSRTRTRGQRPWREVYVAHLCVECTQEGHLAVRTEAGQVRLTSGQVLSSSDSVWLCSRCFGAVRRLRTHGDRRAQGLPRVRAGRGLLLAEHHQWLLHQIPAATKTGRKLPKR